MSKPTMRAVRVHEWGVAPSLDVVNIPEVRPSETLVHVEAAAVAHLDLTVSSGSFDLKPELPYIGGVEGCGIVVESDSLAPGTRVLLRGGGLGLIRGGTWAEYVVAKTKTITPVADGMSAEMGATFFVPTTTAYVTLHDVARLGRWGMDGVDRAADEIVVVAGAVGAVGSVVVQLALREGCTVIGLVADDDQRCRVAAGAEALTAQDAGRIAELAEERSATLLVDTLGGQALAERARWVRPGGRAVCVGYVAGKDVTIHLPSWLLDDVAMIPTNMIRQELAAREHAPMLAQMVADGDLRIDVETFPFEEAGRALDLLASGGLRGRAVLVPATS